MAFWKFLGRSKQTFDSQPKPIDMLFQQIFNNSGTSVGRQEALSVPAVQKGRNLLASISTLPLVQIGPDGELVDNPLLRQFDLDVPNVVHIAQTVEDLLFDGVAWWLITASDFAGFPMDVRRLEPSSVSLVPPTGKTPAPLPGGSDPRGAVVYIDGNPVAASRVIRFDSPNPGILAHCGRTIRRAIALELTAQMYAEDPRPLDYFTPGENADEIDDDEVKPYLAKWKAARKQRATAWIPRSMEYHTVDAPSPQELQLVELQKQVWLEIAQLLGVDTEELGVSTTSRTYFNSVDRKQSFINDVLAPYMSAITDRLSMGDVTRRGHKVQFDLRDYLKPDPASRIAYYQGLKALGAITTEEIRAAEGLGPMPAEDPQPAQVVPKEDQAVDASTEAQHTFDDQTLTFADVELTEFSVDRDSRTITGLALPYGKYGMKAGMKFRFDKNALQYSDPTRVKLNLYHDTQKTVGYAEDIRSTSAGYLLRFKVARGPAGDEALSLAEDKVLDGMSVGVNFDLSTDTIPDPRDKSALLVKRADFKHVALTAEPSFDDARVVSVHASQDGEVNKLPDEIKEPVEAPAAVQQTFTADDVAKLLSAVSQPRNDYDAAKNTNKPVDERQVVNPARLPAGADINGTDSYTFDNRGNLIPGRYDFSTDLFASIRGDVDAKTRVNDFVQMQFDVVQSNVTALNPNKQRPDLFVDKRDFTTPVWDAVNKGNLADATPFVVPKWNSEATLVGAHTQGTEPSSGAYTATSQTVTPVAKSGKVKISREVYDAGGNPQVSNLIWTRMNRAWYEILEAAVIAELDNATPTSLATFTVGGGTNKQTLVAELEAALSNLQFVRGGFTMTDLFTQIDLYNALVAAKDTSLRPYFPVLGPMNARGTVSSKFGQLDINGVTATPTWALAATSINASSSYLIDRVSVAGWASAPNRIDITQTEIANIYVGLFGYVATAILDINGVREVIYDPA